MADVVDTADHAASCRCPGCPSRPADGGRLYCARGLSVLRARTVTCVCPECAVYLEAGLAEGYFCVVPADWWQKLRRGERLRS